MKLKFPNLHKGVTKIGNEDTFILSDYIYIKDYHAFNFHDSGKNMAIIDLKTTWSALTEEDDVDLNMCLDILGFLDNKFISPGFWSELVTGEELFLVDHVSSPYVEIFTKGIKKHLYLSELEGDDVIKASNDFKNIIDATISKYAIYDRSRVEVSNVNFGFLTILNSIYGHLIKNDLLLVEHLGNDIPQRFSFKDNRQIFGFLSVDYDATQELFISLNMENYVKNGLKQNKVVDFTIEPYEKNKA